MVHEKGRTMRKIDEQLWERLEAFELDDPRAAFPFSAKLAKENGWTRGYALRVIDEYKRFLLLCEIAEHVASPSDQVDQCWHMHLTHTRSYWDDLCGAVLGHPLHHGPTRGGDQERTKYWELYRRTLATYREAFGAAPPADIWPPVEERFGAKGRYRRVNLSRCWVAPKLRWPAPKRGVATGLAAALPPLALGVTNPLDMRGPDFLGFYLMSFIAAVVVSSVARRLLRNRDAWEAEQPLTPYQTAYLANGSAGAIQAGVCKLARAEIVEIRSEGAGSAAGRVVVRQPLTADAPALEKAIHAAAERDGGATASDINAGARPEVEKIQAELENRGLLENARSFLLPIWAPRLILGGLLLLGVLKIVVGVQRERPVGALVVLCVFTVVAIFLFSRRARLSLAGEQALSDYRRRYGKLRAEDNAKSDPDTVALAVGLFGVGVLPSMMPDLGIDALGWTSNSSSTDRSFSGGDSGCGGGGDSGCGGGCGGCGGCGGD